MTTRTGSRQQELIAFLESIGIDVNRVPYPAHSTVEEGRFLRGDMPGTFTKNLLLKDNRGRLFLVVAEEARSGLSPMQLVRFIAATGHQHIVVELDT